MIHSDTHRANQIEAIGAASKNPSPLLSGTGAIPQNAQYPRKQKSPCVIIDWRRDQTASLRTSFSSFFFCVKKKDTVSPFKMVFAKLL